MSDAEKNVDTEVNAENVTIEQQPTETPAEEASGDNTSDSAGDEGSE